jgi:hypothetical protein
MLEGVRLAAALRDVSMNLETTEIREVLVQTLLHHAPVSLALEAGANDEL